VKTTCKEKGTERGLDPNAYGRKREGKTHEKLVLISEEEKRNTAYLTCLTVREETYQGPPVKTTTRMRGTINWGKRRESTEMSCMWKGDLLLILAKRGGRGEFGRANGNKLPCKNPKEELANDFWQNFYLKGGT